MLDFRQSSSCSYFTFTKMKIVGWFSQGFIQQIYSHDFPVLWGRGKENETPHSAACFSYRRADGAGLKVNEVWTKSEAQCLALGVSGVLCI